MNKIVSKVLSSIASLVPTTKMICFSSFPDYTDNAYGIYHYFLKRELNKQFRLVWVVAEKGRLTEIQNKLKKDAEGISVVYKYSINGIWTYIRSRYVFETHGMFSALKLKQHDDKHIALWHGMPLKKIGASIGQTDCKNCNYLIATSKTYQKIMAEAFAKPLEKVLVTGQPRCDLMFEETDWFKTVGIDKSNYQSVGMWMPTFRKSIVGDIREEGNYNDHAVSFLEEKDMRSLDAVLKEMNILLLLKIHPMDALQNSSFDSFSNIFLIKPQDFHSQLYPLLGACDFLLTDYSSVFIDYLILQRPIGFVMNDIDNYKNSRGFYFNDLIKILPGPVLQDFDSLCEFIKAPFLVRNEIDFNANFDNRSSERIWEIIGN